MLAILHLLATFVANLFKPETMYGHGWDGEKVVARLILVFQDEHPLLRRDGAGARRRCARRMWPARSCSSIGPLPTMAQRKTHTMRF
jgi:hypothetical protein